MYEANGFHLNSLSRNALKSRDSTLPYINSHKIKTTELNKPKNR